MCCKNFESLFANKIQSPKMLLNREFCMEKLLAREVLIFYSKFIKPTPNCKKSLLGFQTFEKKLVNLPESRVRTFGLSPLPMQNACSKTFLDIRFLFVNRLSKYLRCILGLKEC